MKVVTQVNVGEQTHWKVAQADHHVTLMALDQGCRVELHFYGEGTFAEFAGLCRVVDEDLCREREEREAEETEGGEDCLTNVICPQCMGWLKVPLAAHHCYYCGGRISPT